MATVTYISTGAPGFGFTVKDGEGGRKHIKCENGQYVVDSEDVVTIAAIDDAIRRYPAIARNFRKVDREAAAEVARRFVRSQAAKGAFNTGHLTAMQRETLAASTQALQESAPNNPEGMQGLVTEMAAAGVTVVETIPQTIPSTEAPPKFFPALKPAS